MNFPQSSSLLHRLFSGKSEQTTNPEILRTIAVLAAIVFVWSVIPAQCLTTSNSVFEQIKLPPNTPNPQNLRQYRLKSNGLDVILCERHETPIVTTMVVYHIGSRNEAVGYTGSTHFLEHMMFKGTKAHDPLKKTGFDDVLKPLGGYNNATTSQDRTNYFETVPAKSLPVTLEIESDRMRNLLLRQSDRASEMTVVRNELERGEDNAAEILTNNLFSTAFKEHPYHHPTIGWRTDVEGVPIERLRQFYKDFYYPDNATLIIVGDFNSDNALNQIEKYFGKIPRSPKPYPKVYTVEPPQEGERRFIVKRGSESPKMIVGYHATRALDKDTYALNIIENMLGDESKRSSRLYKALVDKSLASAVATYDYAMHDPGLFTVSAAAAPNVPLDKIEKAIIKEFDRFKTDPVTADELNRAKQSINKRLKLDASDPTGLADILTETLATANLNWYLNYSKNIDAVSPADVMRVANKYFGDNNRTVGYYLPKKEVETQVISETPESSNDSAADAPPAVPAESDALTKVRLATTKNGKAPMTFANRVVKKVLPNGLTVQVMPIAGTDTVAVSGKVQAGRYFRDLQKSQVPEFVADLLTKGSDKFSKETLAKRLEEMGTTLDFNEDECWISFDTEVITEEFPSMIAMVSDCMRNPKFNSSELAKTKKQKNTVLKDKISSTTEQSWNALQRALYKPSSMYYEKPFEEQVAELDKWNASDLKAFHDAHFIPANTVITVVGDINPDDAIATVAKQFDDWKGGAREEIKLSETDLNPVKAEKLSVPLPDKANIDVMFGHSVPVSVKSKDWFAASIANAALGYDSFACRLAPVRDEYGLTYSINSAMVQPAEKYGAWVVMFSVNPENYDKAVGLVRKIVAEYQKSGITPRELAIEKTHLAGTFYVALRSTKQIASRLCQYEILGIGPERIDDQAKLFSVVTAGEVNAAIRKYLRLDQAVLSSSGTFQKPETKH